MQEASKMNAIARCALPTVLMITALAATPAAGQGGKPDPAGIRAPDFSTLDHNHDGQLVRSEIPQDMRWLRVRWRAYDVDGSTRLSAAEYHLAVKDEARRLGRPRSLGPEAPRDRSPQWGSGPRSTQPIRSASGGG
jgi:hypothetical protein